MATLGVPTMARPGPSRWFFDVWSRFYDLAPVQHAIYRPIHDAVVREFAAHGCRALLDLGCGTGLLTTRITRTLPAARVVGLDFSHGMLRQARARDPRTWSSQQGTNPVGDARTPAESAPIG